MIVWNDVKRIDIINHLTKKLTYDKEAVVLRLPVRGREADVPIRSPGGHRQRQHRHAARSVPGLVHRAAFRRGRRATTASRLGHARRAAGLLPGRQPRQVADEAADFTNGHLYAYVMNNYWYTNYLAGQGGDFVFRFALTSRPQADSVASAQFGCERLEPAGRRRIQRKPRRHAANGTHEPDFGRRTERDAGRRKRPDGGPG